MGLAQPLGHPDLIMTLQYAHPAPKHQAAIVIPLSALFPAALERPQKGDDHEKLSERDQLALSAAVG